jgi:ABC-type antimicrobial peptide transport system permease subunit
VIPRATAAVLFSHLIRSFLFGVDSGDPLTYFGAVGIVLLACLAASYLPARRVQQLQPAQVLKEE